MGRTETLTSVYRQALKVSAISFAK